MVRRGAGPPAATGVFGIADASPTPVEQGGVGVEILRSDAALHRRQFMGTRLSQRTRRGAELTPLFVACAFGTWVATKNQILQ
jgi:hypothetical protein